MSTQLILFPQNYNGQYNYTSNSTTAVTNFISNGQLFSGLGSTALYSTDAVKPPLAAILNEHPYIVNTWYRFTTIVGPPGNWGAVTAPSVALNSLLLSFAAAEGHTGVYQQLTGLTVGAVYSVKITITTGQVGTISLATYLPNTGLEQAGAQFSSNTTAINWNFSATSTNQILSLDYFGTVANLYIENIAVIAITTTPSGIYTDLIDGQVICDLYQEEDIPLTLSIDDFKNVAEKVQSYSKDFNLPATKRNNRIFNNMFEVTRADDGIIFNPYVKTKCILKQDGFILFEGYLRLINAKDKDGEISYNVNLYSEVIALADTLKDKKFADLDFTELTHEYNKQEIKRSWNDSGTGITWTKPSTSGFRTDFNTLKYPFIDWTGNINITTNTSSSGPTPSNPELTSLEQAFRPCIQLKYLIERIFAASGFNFTSNFFNSADFENLYMDFNWGSDNIPVTMLSGGEGHIDANQIATASFALIQTNNNTFPAETGYSAGIYTATMDNQTYDIQYSYNYDVTNNVPWSGTFQWILTRASGTVEPPIDLQTVTGTGDIANIFGQQIYGTFSKLLNTGDTLHPEFKSATASTNGFYVFVLGSPGSIFGTAGATIVQASAAAVTNNIFLQTLRGELGQWDFLKGIMTMFNLVSMVDENDPDNILIEPYSDIFIKNTNSLTPTTPNNNSLAARSIEHDWTDKVDVSEMGLKPLTDLNKNTIFKFVEDDDDYAFNVYKNSTSGALYGAQYWDASALTILQGTEEIIAEPFAATISKPLFYQFPAFVVPSIYSKSDDGSAEGFDNSPRIFYNNGKISTGISYYIPAQNGLNSENQSDFLQFSHLSDIPTISTTRDFVFSSHQLFQPIGNSPTDNLFNTYWLPYFAELYSADTRTMTLKVNLSPADVASFKFYDTVFIKNRSFRVNKIQYKPNSLATVEFILIP